MENSWCVRSSPLERHITTSVRYVSVLYQCRFNYANANQAINRIHIISILLNYWRIGLHRKQTKIQSLWLQSVRGSISTRRIPNPQPQDTASSLKTLSHPNLADSHLSILIHGIPRFEQK